MTIESRRVEPIATNVADWAFPCLVVHRREPTIYLVGKCPEVKEGEVPFHDAVLINGSDDRIIGTFYEVSPQQLQDTYRLYTGSVHLKQE